ncbi:T6SS phospholipase effector Tle1-like catalytic domain-containing protein [Colwellia echini]|uniref:DUF2235 domain-containing protein n=1 Tax=Colwellia echini TaxID=1982103 RepID=A0ABY3N1S1_9GAMM|nr:DUF2235 domain-containing protein [Colwellia echini]TYK67438.1 DUF2235 domain-containing protein [Colwellia echini]
MKKLIFCFDGTCNNPEDVADFYDDSSISNILKLHILFGGTLNNKVNDKSSAGLLNNTNITSQHSFYYSGIGNRGNWLFRAVNAAFAPPYGEMNDILSEAQTDFAKHYSPGDKVYIFGFSRGAALARMFAAHLSAPVTFLGVFDTVAATKGSLDLNPDTFPSSGIVFENDILAPHIERALHILGLDERRLWFQPTLFNHDERVTEVWFAGSHSDIGGGYWFDGLSDVCLQFMLDNIADELFILSVNDIDFSRLQISGSKEVITFDDIYVKPLSNGKLHGQLYTYGYAITHAPRSVRINLNELASNYTPIIHHSVVDRFNQLVDYRPYALRNINYQILDANGNLSEPRLGISGLY